MTLENQAASAGLRINGQKTKVAHIGYVNSRVPITIDGKTFMEESVPRIINTSDTYIQICSTSDLSAQQHTWSESHF